MSTSRFSIEDGQFVKSLGFLREGTAATANLNADGSIVSPYYRLYDPDLKNIPVKLTHGYARGTWMSLGKQLMMFDHEFPFDSSLTSVFEWSFQEMKQMFSRFSVHSSILKVEEVLWNYEATPGFGYKKEFSTKRAALNDPSFRSESNLFWKTAVDEQFDPLWKVSSKDEYLPFEKILEENLRCFEIPPIQFLEFALRIVQSFNKSMSAHSGEWMIKVGFAMQNGGFSSLFSDAKRKSSIFVAGDVKKWDKHFSKELRDYCRRLRIAQFDGRNMTHEEFVKRLDYVYRVCSYETYVITPWGQVFLLNNGMKSGDPSTTYDNMIAHVLLFMAYVKYQYPELSGWEELMMKMEPAFYADDHFFGAVQEFAFLCQLNRRAKFYKRVGFTLKPEDDRVQDTIVGIPFLGATCVLHEGRPAPQYNLQRIWSSIVYLGRRKMPLDQYFMKVRSLMVLATFNGLEEFLKIRRFVEFVRALWIKQGSRMTSLVGDDEQLIVLPGSFVPDFSYCVQWWLGLENNMSQEHEQLLARSQIL